jgi:glucose-1-phosphate thymidylyltransferase|tara:strand:+ start:1011 stop:1355 length:345 start_codon:yes stop_codon:yes gene_type:complete
VLNLEYFCIIEIDSKGKAVLIEEKPNKSISSFSVTSLYFSNREVIDITKFIKFSARGELEISSVNGIYLRRDDLNAELLGRGFALLDTGIHTSILEDSQFVHTLEKRQGFKLPA